MTRRRKEVTLGEVGEFGFLDRLLPDLGARDARIIVGVGDDCAVVASPEGSLILTTDVLVEGVHFRANWLSDGQLGRRAFLVNASDIAAMGGAPLWCLVSLGAPASQSQASLLRMMKGLTTAAREHGATVVGGNVSRSDALFVSVTLIGTAKSTPVARSGARPGDLLFVSGELGGAAAAVRRLVGGEKPGSRSRALRAYAEPPARTLLGQTLAAARVPAAMIDISDGFLQDLGHLCDASEVGAIIDVAAVPVATGTGLARAAALELAVSGGEDYELLFAVPARLARRVAAIGRKAGCRLTMVGKVTREPGIRARDAAQQAVLDGLAGHDHFLHQARRRAAPRPAAAKATS